MSGHPAYDVHQHLWPEAFIAELARRSEPPCLDGRTLRLPGELDSEVDLDSHDLAARLALLDRHGIDVALVSIPPGYLSDPEDELARAYHNGILELVAASGGRIQALAAASCREGFAGACVSAQSLVAGLDLLLDELSQAGQILFVHPGPPRDVPGDAPAWWSAVVDYTAQMQAAYAAWLARDAARFPELPVIFAILAGGAPVPARAPAVARLRRPFGDAPERLLRHVLVRSARARALPRDLRRHSARPRKRRARDRRATDARRGAGIRRGRRANRHAREPEPAAPRVTIRSMSDVERLDRERIPGGEDLGQARLAELAVELGGERAALAAPREARRDRAVYAELYRDVHLDIWLICWDSEQDTGFHDHDFVLRAPCTSPTASSPRTVCSSRRARSSQVSRRHPAGSVFDFDAARIHCVRNPGRHPRRLAPPLLAGALAHGVLQLRRRREPLPPVGHLCGRDVGAAERTRRPHGLTAPPTPLEAAPAELARRARRCF